MKTAMLGMWALCVLVAAAGVTAAGPDTIPPRFTVNMDLPPQDRWTHIINTYEVELVEYLPKIFGTYVPENIQPLLFKLAENLEDYLPVPIASEIKGIAACANISVGEALLPNILYDITAFCTSIVAQDEHGNIWHGRNMDYLFTEMLRNITIEVDIMKSGRILYTTTTYPGLVGVLTGQKPGIFTVSLNQRDKGLLLENILMALLDKKANAIMFLLRQALEEAHSYSEALAFLTNAQTVASEYIVLGGVHPGEGAVITHGRLGPLDVHTLDPLHGRWFVLETNYDRWLPPPKSDDRRGPGNTYMHSLGQGGVGGKGLYSVLSTPPLLRIEGMTVYTTVMSAAQPGYYFTRIRHYP